MWRILLPPSKQMPGLLHLGKTRYDRRHRSERRNGVMPVCMYSRVEIRPPRSPTRHGVGSRKSKCVRTAEVSNLRIGTVLMHRVSVPQPSNHQISAVHSGSITKPTPKIHARRRRSRSRCQPSPRSAKVCAATPGPGPRPPAPTAGDPPENMCGALAEVFCFHVCRPAPAACSWTPGREWPFSSPSAISTTRHVRIPQLGGISSSTSCCSGLQTSDGRATGSAGRAVRALR